ncbi:hypothetical protein BC940DRAFT_112236 [Gongronella butleri]|nr:hypothetical protein BC940DRAFT_112236 [Gongronella butleri]
MERDKLFEVDPYGVVAEQRDHSLLSSSDSLPTTSQASYSLPGSRRNSTDAEDSSLMEAFDVKLKLQPPQQQQNQQHQHQQQQQQQEFVAPHRSMSVDETALKHKLHIGSSAANPSDKQRFLFDHDADRAPTRQPYLKRYGGSTETLSSFGHGDYSGFVSGKNQKKN